MGNINDCIKALKLDAEDAEEIRRQARLAGDDALAGVAAYTKSLQDDINALRTTLSDKGYDLAPKRPAAKASEEPSFVDLMDGGDPVNIANVAVEHIALAKSLANTMPGWNTTGDVFKWLGNNSKRLTQFKASHFYKFEDEVDMDRMLVQLQKDFPDTFMEASRGKVTDKQAMNEASALMRGKNKEQIIEGVLNTPAGYAANVSEQHVARFAFNMLYDDVFKLSQRALKDPTWNPTAAELQEAQNMWERLGMMGAKYGGYRSEAGRSLRQPGTPEDWFNKALKATAKGANIIAGTDVSNASRKALLADLGKAMSMLDPGDNLQLDLFVANLHQNKGNLGDKFYELYYNWGLLSNPSTQVINFLGNTAHSVMENIERGAAAALTPGERLPFLYRLAGYGASLSDSVKLGFKTYMTELPTDPQTRMENMDKHAFSSWRVRWDNGLKFDKAGVGEGGVVIGGKQARAPGRLLLGLDEMTKFQHQTAYIYESMARAAQEAGVLKDKAARDAFFKQFLADIPQEVQEAALEESRRLTYTDKLGPGLRAFQQFVDELPGGRIIIPFVRTPAKIIKQAADMLSIPGVVATDRTAADFAAGGLQRKRALARVTLGYSLLGVGALMAANGDATGPSPSDPGERGSFDAYALPWSAKVGNNWIQFNRFDPVAIPLTVGVGLEKTFEAFAASGTGAEREDSYLATMAAFMSDALLDKSFFQGVENVVGAIMEPERRAESFAKGVVRSFTPAITAGFARAVDPRTTAPLTFQEVIQDRIGFDARKKVPTKIDDLGREVAVEVPGTYKGEEGVGATIARFVIPFKAKSGGDDPVASELYELKVKLGWDTKRYKSVELDSAQQYVLRKATGTTFYNQVRYLQSLPEWQTFTPAAKRIFIDGAKENARAMGRMMLEGTYPELIRLGATENRDLKRLTGPVRSEISEFMTPGGAKKLDERR